MKTINLATYRDKVMGCWAGKNIGGVLGAPFEAWRQVNDVSFYKQDLSMGPPPNDDLDLQILWLAAVERYGRNVNASILGEYWLSFVVPHWVEYGTGKNNMRAGLKPPLSGMIDNRYKDSCGCFIRSEIWACLAPGHPEVAARYAYEDAIVDHQGEGMFGEVFFAAMESAAFVESDKRKLIDIGLSYIPQDSVISQVVRKAIECYDTGVPFLDARKIIHNMAPGSFGLMNIKLSQIKKEGNEGLEVGKAGFDAPENIGFTIAGWMYGEDDFGKSICLANSCGEDTDCTCATLGALMGIIHGESGLPEKWKAPLNDKIATMCIDKTGRVLWVPATVTELTDRVIRDMPMFLGHEFCDILSEEGMTITMRDGDDLYCRKPALEEYLPGINGRWKPWEPSIGELCQRSPYIISQDFPAFRVLVDYCGTINYKYGQTNKIRVRVENYSFMAQQHWAKITLYMPQGVEVLGGTSVELPLNNTVGACAETEFEFSTDAYNNSRLEFIVDVSLVGRHSSGPVKVTMMRAN